MNLNKFCCCFDLKKGILVYAWLQLLPISIIIAKAAWITEMFRTQSRNHPHFVNPVELIVTASFNLICAVQIIKMFSSLGLMWGITKNNFMFYQPWLFINGIENIVLSITSIGFFIWGFLNSIVFNFFVPFFIITVFGLYIWFCVYELYKREDKTEFIKFEENIEVVV